MDNTNQQRIISFCTGGRMLDMGLERVVGDLRTVAAVEVEAFAIFNQAKADFLRMLGNGVVGPVAAHAFYDLLLKQAKTLI